MRNLLLIKSLINILREAKTERQINDDIQLFCFFRNFYQFASLAKVSKELLMKRNTQNKIQFKINIKIIILKMTSIEAIDDRYASQIRTQEKLALIFNKADHIINELNYYRDHQTESFYYEPQAQPQEMKLVKVVQLTLFPSKARSQSVGSQTQMKSVRYKTQFPEQMGGRVSSTKSSQSQQSSERFPSKFASTIVVKQICLNSPSTDLDRSLRKNSKSKGISILSESPCKNKSAQKSKIKIKLGKNAQRRNNN